MVRSKSAIAFMLVALFAVMILAPVSAFASTQSKKNTWRNIGIGSAAVGAYGLLHHNTALGVVGIAGAAYSASRYEKERHKQSVEQHGRYYHRGRYWTHRYYKNGAYHYY